MIDRLPDILIGNILDHLLWSDVESCRLCCRYLCQHATQQVRFVHALRQGISSDQLSQVLKNTRNAKQVTIKDCTRVGENVIYRLLDNCYWEALTELHLGNVNLSGVFLQWLNLSTMCSTLTVLDIDGNVFSECDRLELFVVHCLKNLVRLRFSGFHDFGNAQLGVVLAHCKQLEALELEECSALTGYVSKRKNASVGVERLRLSKCLKLDDIVLDSFSADRLTWLDLSYNQRISSQVVEYIVDKCKVLRQLFLKACPEVVDLPNLTNPSLVLLDLKFCTALRLVVITDCPSLHTLQVGFCNKLDTLSISWAPLITALDFSLLDSLRVLELKNLPRLSSVKLQGCHRLEVEDFSNLDVECLVERTPRFTIF